MNAHSIIRYRNDLTARARELRRTQTDQERRLWYGYLRRSPYRFLRQKPIGEYIADFFCPEAALVVELDGRQHFTEEALEYDARRTRFLETLGIKVMRYRNCVVDQYMEGVWRQIKAEVVKRIAEREHPQSASPTAPSRGP